MRSESIANIRPPSKPGPESLVVVKRVRHDSLKRNSAFFRSFEVDTSVSIANCARSVDLVHVVHRIAERGAVFRVERVGVAKKLAKLSLEKWIFEILPVEHADRVGNVNRVPGAETGTSSTCSGEVSIGDVGLVGEVSITRVVDVELVVNVEFLDPGTGGSLVAWYAFT